MMSDGDAKGTGAAALADEHSGDNPGSHWCFCQGLTGASDEDMVACDGVECALGGWVHYACIGYNKHDVRRLPDPWICPSCVARQ